ncbi:MAG: DNA primase [Bacteroidia bacterium]
MITKSTVDQIIETARIEEVVSDFVTLKKRGANFLGLCPFHNEKTPSFTVSAAKGIYKCFGCGKAGNAVGFIMEHEHYSFPEALRFLAQKYNIAIEEEFSKEEDLQEKNEKESLFIVSAYAQEFYSGYLWSSEEGKATGLTYFEERGFKEKTIEKFQLGFAPSEGKAFTELALKNGYQLEYLEKSGLTIVNEGKQYDRFRGRVIFPIHNLTGRVIGFGARILQKDPKAPKYINSPETDIYHKSKILYGIYFAKKSIIEKDECYLTEGYTDVVSLHQEGIENVVASSGTSLTIEQIKLIGRYTKNITVLYDGDAAGIKASLRGIDLILEEGLNVKVVLFPDGEDPDSFAKKHSHSELVEFLKNNSQDFIRFKTSLLLSEVQNDPVRKAGLIKEIVETISKIPDVIIREMYVQQCSQLMDVSEPVLILELNKIRRKHFTKQHEQVASNEIDDLLPETIRPEQSLLDELSAYWQEAEIIRLLLNYSEHDLYFAENEEGKEEQPAKIKVKNFIVNELLNDGIEFEEKIYSRIFSDFGEWVNNEKDFDRNYFTNHNDIEIKEAAIDMMSSAHELSNWESVGIFVPTEEKVLQHQVLSAVYMLKTRKVQTMIKQNQEEIKNRMEANEECIDLLEKHKSLENVKQQLTKYLGIVVVK